MATMKRATITEHHRGYYTLRMERTGDINTVDEISGTNLAALRGYARSHGWTDITVTRMAKPVRGVLHGIDAIWRNK